MKKTLSKILITLLVVIMLVGCAQPAAPVATEEAAPEETGPVKLQFRLNWTLYGEHAHFFVGVDKGFYADEGLDVEIQEGSGSSTVVKLIGNGTNVIGYADAATMMRGVTVGVPVTAVAVLLQTSAMSFIYRADAARPTTLEEIPGSRIAITQGDASMNIFTACLQKNGLSLDDVEMVVVANPAAKETAVLEGQSDSFLGYYIDQPMRMQKVTGVEMGWSKLYDVCDVNTMSSAIIVNNTWMKDNPEIVQKFVRATQRALQYSIDNPEEAAAIFASHAEAFDEELSLREILGFQELLHTPNTEGKPLGWSAPEDWTATQDLLAEYADLKPEADINVYFNNDYIAEPPYTP